MTEFPGRRPFVVRHWPRSRVVTLTIILGAILSTAAVPLVSWAQTSLWDSMGVVVTAASGYQFPMDAISDGTGGAILVWDDNRAVQGVPDVFAQRINGDGAALWQINGTLI